MVPISQILGLGPWTKSSLFVLQLQCLYELVTEAHFLAITELDTLASVCFRALDGSNYDVRCDVAKLLGHLLTTALAPKHPQQGKYSVSQGLG